MARADLCLADAAVIELLARIAELEAHAEHDEDNMEGLQHALVRANQQYTQANTALAERDRMLREAWWTYCRPDMRPYGVPSSLYGPWLFDLRVRIQGKKP